MRTRLDAYSPVPPAFAVILSRYNAERQDRQIYIAPLSEPFPISANVLAVSCVGYQSRNPVLNVRKSSDTFRYVSTIHNTCQ